MKKKYDSPATVVLTINHITLLSGSPLRSDGKALRLNSRIETDASNAASRSYELDDD